MQCHICGKSYAGNNTYYKKHVLVCSITSCNLDNKIDNKIDDKSEKNPKQPIKKAISESIEDNDSSDDNTLLLLKIIGQNKKIINNQKNIMQLITSGMESLKKYPAGLVEGQVVHEPKSGAISKLVNGQKCWFPTPIIYAKYGSPSYTSMSDFILDTIPNGPNFT
jgi:hypothetical protein